MANALVIDPRGNVTVRPVDGLEQIQKIVGGWIEGVYLGPDMTAFVNEEGKLLNLPFNERATKLFQKTHPMTEDYLCGNLVIFGPIDEDGEVTDITAQILAEINE